MKYMASINAINVAKKVKQKIMNGEKVEYGKIIRDSGYSDYVSKSVAPVTRTKAYQSIMIPFLQRLESHRDKLLQEMNRRDLSKEDYRILSEAFDRMNKNVQIASGKLNINDSNVTINVINYNEAVNETMSNSFDHSPSDPRNISVMSVDNSVVSTPAQDTTHIDDSVKDSTNNNDVPIDNDE